MISGALPTPPEDIRAQLQRILESAELEQSPRLKDFLTYVVEETLAGRADRIKGVTVAQAVFSADGSFDPDSNSAVRVQAGRLRRRLREYYAGPGRLDPIVIAIPKGTYAPTFTANGQDAGQGIAPTIPSARRLRRAARRSLILAAVLAVAAIAWLALRPESPTPASRSPVSSAPDAALGGEARVLFRQAFEVLMPPQDGARMDAAIGLFDRVIEVAPRFAGGYTGKSLAQAFKVLFLRSQEPEDDLRSAVSLAEEAIKLDPEYGLAQAVLAIAKGLERDEEAAIARAQRALGGARPDADVYAMSGLALLLAGRPKDARELESRAIELNPDAPRTPYLNLVAVARYLTGDFGAAADALELNIARGGPSGPHMDVFLAATYARLGREFEGRAVIERLRREYPDFPVKDWLGWYLHEETELEATMQLLEGLGYSADGVSD